MSFYCSTDSEADSFELMCILKADQNMNIKEYITESGGNEDDDNHIDDISRKILKRIKLHNSNYPFTLHNSLLKVNKENIELYHSYFFLLLASPCEKYFLEIKKDTRKDLESNFESYAHESIKKANENEEFIKTEVRTFKLGTVDNPYGNLQRALPVLCSELGLQEGTQKPTSHDKDCGVDFVVYHRSSRTMGMWQATIQKELKSKIQQIDTDMWEKFIGEPVKFKKNLVVPFPVDKDHIGPYSHVYFCGRWELINKFRNVLLGDSNKSAIIEKLLDIVIKTQE